MHVVAVPAQTLKPERAAETAATAAPPFPLALQGEEIGSAEDRCAEAIRGLSLGCPSIYPNLRYRLVLLHERCAYLDGILLLQEFETQAPAAGGRIRLGDDVLDLGLLCGHNAPQSLWVQPVADQIQHEQCRVIASRADASSGKSRKRSRFRSVRPPVQPVGIAVFALACSADFGCQSSQCCRVLLPWSEFQLA